MFKVGDKIRSKKDTPAFKAYGDFIFIVDTPCKPGDHNHVCYKEPNGTHNGWCASWFELVNRTKPITETDFLNCFKENFKEGV